MAGADGDSSTCPSQTQYIIVLALSHIFHICHLLGPLTFLRSLTQQSCREPKEGIGGVLGKAKSHLSMAVSAECLLARVYLGGDISSNRLVAKV